FFFSSRRRHTRLQGDWSSDVCSSDLRVVAEVGAVFDIHFKAAHDAEAVDGGRRHGHDERFLDIRELLIQSADDGQSVEFGILARSEERRVGKECRAVWWWWHDKKSDD